MGSGLGKFPRGCSAGCGVLTLCSVPLSVRSGSVSVRRAVWKGISGIRTFWTGIPGWVLSELGWRSSAGRASDL